MTKRISASLRSFLDAKRVAADADVAYAECFTFRLSIGTTFTFTNSDVPITYKGQLFRNDGILVSGLRYKSTVGLNVDRQQITLSARPNDTMLGAAFLSALSAGALDGCEIQRDRVYFSDHIGGTVVDGITLFLGRFSTLDECGRTSATATVATDLVILEEDFPRQVYQTACNHTLYDAGCGLPAAAFSTSGVIGAGSTRSTIVFAGASAVYLQGTIQFTNGVNGGIKASIKTFATGSLGLMYPLPFQPVVGDAFQVFQGCDHTLATCIAKFNNKANFFGFIDVPEPKKAQ